MKSGRTRPEGRARRREREQKRILRGHSRVREDAVAACLPSSQNESSAAGDAVVDEEWRQGQRAMERAARAAAESLRLMRMR